MPKWRLTINHVLEKERAIRKSLLLTPMLAVLSASAPSMAGPSISAQGQALTVILDGTRVEELWLAGRRVDWLTGEPDGKPVRGTGRHPHCSAFVAAVACRLGIYILRPPDHSQTLLANAQMDWLAARGSGRGWFVVRSGEQAQQLANEGFLVVAGYKNHNPRVSGHIATVRPDEKGGEALRNEGPAIIQAGSTNYRTTSLRHGFRQHPGAFERGEICFFAHAVDPGRFPVRAGAGASPSGLPQSLQKNHHGAHLLPPVTSSLTLAGKAQVTHGELGRFSPVTPGSL